MQTLLCWVVMRHWAVDTIYEEHRSRHLWVPEAGFPGAQTLPRGVGGGV